MTRTRLKKKIAKPTGFAAFGIAAKHAVCGRNSKTALSGGSA